MLTSFTVVADLDLCFIRISSRRRNIRNLRELDYKKYEWLLEKLNMLYKPQPHDTPRGVLGVKENVARKASIEKLTDLWCSELRRHRLRYLNYSSRLKC